MSRKAVLTLQLLFLILITVAISQGQKYLNKPSSSSKTLLAPTDKRIKAEGTLNIYDSDRAFPGVTLIASVGTAETFLIDMNANILQSWPVDSERARLLPNGNLLVISGTKWGSKRAPWKKIKNNIREYSWNGEIVWKYIADDVLHHDLHRLDNGNTLLLKRSFVPESLYTKLESTTWQKSRIRSDTAFEISPDGKIIWQWNTYDHIDLNNCGKRSCAALELDEDKHVDWTHTNSISYLPENIWFDQGDSRFKPGNLLILPRNLWSIFIADKQSGKIVWTYHGNYRGGLSGGHEANMIDKGLPGAGNILVIDNGTSNHKGESFILEISPPDQSLTWVYDKGHSFYTKTRGSVQRLANGNTLISEDLTGRIFEVTPSKEIVWEYKIPFESNRSQRYPYNYCPGCVAKPN